MQYFQFATGKHFDVLSLFYSATMSHVSFSHNIISYLPGHKWRFERHSEVELEIFIRNYLLAIYRKVVVSESIEQRRYILTRRPMHWEIIGVILSSLGATVQIISKLKLWI